MDEKELGRDEKLPTVSSQRRRLAKTEVFTSRRKQCQLWIKSFKTREWSRLPLVFALIFHLCRSFKTWLDRQGVKQILTPLPISDYVNRAQLARVNDWPRVAHVEPGHSLCFSFVACEMKRLKGCNVVWRSVWRAYICQRFGKMPVFVGRAEERSSLVLHVSS